MLECKSWEYVIRAAVHEHYKWFCSEQVDDALLDKTFLKNRDNGKLTAELVLKIAAHYRVARGITDKENPKNRMRKARKIAKEVNKLTSDWQSLCLKKRAEKCLEVAETLAENNKATRGVQVSLVSKLAWFVNPDGWTLYDALASNAVGEKEFVAFYQALNDRGFCGLATNINGAMKGTNLDHLYGERFIDKFLWICGQPLANVHRMSEDWKHPRCVTELAEKVATNFSCKFVKLLGK